LAPDVSQFSWLHVQPLLDRSLLPAVADLGPGEAEAIALALSNAESLLILDDSLGRETARLRRLTYTGTLGVLVRSKKEGLLPRVAPVIEDLRRTTMYLSPELISKVLTEAGEAKL
jgi:predicted nucleic acid-binding protein